MTRHTILNPETGRYVFKTGLLGQKIMSAKKRLGKNNKKSKMSKMLVNTSKCTKVTFQVASSMISAQDMVDAGFECGKVIAVCRFDDNKKKLLAQRADGTPYWSAMNK